MISIQVYEGDGIIPTAKKLYRANMVRVADIVGYVRKLHYGVNFNKTFPAGEAGFLGELSYRCDTHRHETVINRSLMLFLIDFHRRNRLRLSNLRHQVVTFVNHEMVCRITQQEFDECMTQLHDDLDWLVEFGDT